VHNFSAALVQHEGRVIIKVRGDVDGATAAEFAACLRVLATASAHVVIDVAEVELIAMAGIDVLIDALQRVGPAGSVTLRHPKAGTLKAVETAGLCDLVKLETSSA